MWQEVKAQRDGGESALKSSPVERRIRASINSRLLTRVRTVVVFNGGVKTINVTAVFASTNGTGPTKNLRLDELRARKEDFGRGPRKNLTGLAHSMFR